MKKQLKGEVKNEINGYCRLVCIVQGRKIKRNPWFSMEEERGRKMLPVGKESASYVEIVL